MSRVIDSFKTMSMGDKRPYTWRSFMSFVFVYGLLFLLLRFSVVSSDDYRLEYEGLRWFWVWCAAGLAVFNGVGVFAFSRLRFFAVFVYLGAVALFPAVLYMCCILMGETVGWYWQQLLWIVGLTFVTLVWQACIFYFYAPLEKIVSLPGKVRYVLWVPFFSFIVLSLALIVVSYQPSRTGGVGTRPGMEWVFPMIFVLFGGGFGFMIFISQFFRMVFFVRGVSSGVGRAFGVVSGEGFAPVVGGGRYGGVFDGFGGKSGQDRQGSGFYGGVFKRRDRRQEE